jgi:hypothetical protein
MCHVLHFHDTHKIFELTQVHGCRSGLRAAMPAHVRSRSGLQRNKKNLLQNHKIVFSGMPAIS